MGSTIILCGFKVSVAVLDAFLAANGVDETHPDKDPISVLLYTKITEAADVTVGIDKNRCRVMIPSREGNNDSFVAYVTYAWVTVYAHREPLLENDLPMEIPKGFEELREEILSFANNSDDKIADEGKMGLFVMYTYGVRGLYVPKEVAERAKVPQYCDRCDAVFDNPHQEYTERQRHRKAVHGCREGTNRLPEA
ncbi:hypothetical protein B0H66DRAFT_576354 [Apodospora peruviana]|uniref:C2H2-type domain-containing protein n=1 Tax=Apodospora peruviana TaxID=516989 RepID=A0AAE0M3E5_9PEZI|nr:hypothetical protein B0H66DRAFT_576354 [Apodospora peruviana]